MRSTLRVVLLAGAAVILAAAVAGADWLVLRGGGRVETAGDWQVKGKLVVFETPEGTLSSLRLSEVDLEASERVTAEAAEAAAAGRRAEADEAAAAPSEKPRAKVVITDADIPRAQLDEPEAADGEEGGDGVAAAGDTAPAEGGEAAGGGRLVVSSWDRQIDEIGIQVTGRVRNDGNQIATGVAVTVRIYDDTGGLLGRTTAPADQAVMPPGASAEFRAFFPEVATFAAARFEIAATSFERRGGSAAEEATEAAGEEGEAADEGASETAP